mgnify:CR=1 FL=1
MSKTDRVRVYYNLHKKCFSIQDYKTGLVIKHTNQLNLSNAMFVVRKSGNERVRSEGKKNVHAFVNGIVSDKSSGHLVVSNSFHNSYKVRYNPYEMDYFHYERIVNNKPKWIPVDNHWIGNVYLFIENGKPVMYADIDKLSATSSTKKLSTHSSKDEKEFGVTELLNTQFFKSSVVGGKFLRKKRKIIDSRNKIKKKTIVI